MKVFVNVILALCLLVRALPMAAGPEDVVARRREDIAKLEKDIAILDKQLSSTIGKERSTLSDLQLLQTKIGMHRKLLRESDRQIAEMDRRIERKNAEIDSVSAVLDTLGRRYNRLLLNVYKNRDVKIWYLYILGSSDFAQAARRTAYFRSLSSQMKAQGQRVQKVREELAAGKDTLATMRAALDSVRDRHKAEVKTLSREEARLNKLLKKISRQKKFYREELRTKKQQRDAFDREIARMLKGGGSSKAKGSASGSGTKTAVDKRLDGDFKANKGKLPWPADGPVVVKFGDSMDPRFRGSTLRASEAIEIALPSGTGVQAVFEGVVRSVFPVPGYGNNVWVQHGSYSTFYCKLGPVNVKAGDKVKAGTILGSVVPIAGDTRLHFMVYQGSKPVNPAYWLR